MHVDFIKGHPRILATYKRVNSIFYQKGLFETVKDIFMDCEICQRNKNKRTHPLNLL